MVARNNWCPYFPSKVHSCLHTLFNEYNDRHMPLIEYFKLIPEFNRISIDDKIRLMTNHFGTMFSINEANTLPDLNNSFITPLKDIYGIELTMNLARCIQTLHVYRYDPILYKLLLIDTTLSSSISRNHNDIDMNRIYDDTKIIFHGQNVYVELLWRYILSRLPSERDAVRFFNKLIQDLLFMLHVIFLLDGFIFGFPDEIHRMEPFMQTMWPLSNSDTTSIMTEVT
jgi:hypothetical protein